MKTVWISILAVIVLVVIMPAEVHALLTSPTTTAATACHDDHPLGDPVHSAMPCDMGLCCLCPAVLPSVISASAVSVITDTPVSAVPQPLLPSRNDGIFRPPRI